MGLTSAASSTSGMCVCCNALANVFQFPQEVIEGTVAYLQYFSDAMTASLTAQVQATPKDALFLSGCFDHVGG